jgi:hypothetical protein
MTKGKKSESFPRDEAVLKFDIELIISLIKYTENEQEFLQIIENKRESFSEPHLIRKDRIEKFYNNVELIKSEYEKFKNNTGADFTKKFGVFLTLIADLKER